MFEQAFKNIDVVLWKEAGCTTELDYTEQTSWLLFLKYLAGLEEDKATEADAPRALRRSRARPFVNAGLTRSPQGPSRQRVRDDPCIKRGWVRGY